MDYVNAGMLLKALGHPVRLRILEGICGHGCNVNKMVRGLKMPQSTVSQHLAVLRNMNIIAPEKQGVKTCYRIVDPRISRLLAVFKK